MLGRKPMTDRVSPFLDLLLAHFFAILRCRSKRHGSGERNGGLTFHQPAISPTAGEIYSLESAVRQLCAALPAVRPILCLNFGNCFVSAGTPFLNHVREPATFGSAGMLENRSNQWPRREKKRRRRGEFNRPMNERLLPGVPCPVVAPFRLLNWPINARLDRRMSRLVHGTTVL
jgi:hypothetical protein